MLLITVVLEKIIFYLHSDINNKQASKIIDIKKTMSYECANNES